MHTEARARKNEGCIFLIEFVGREESLERVLMEKMTHYNTPITVIYRLEKSTAKFCSKALTL